MKLTKPKKSSSQDDQQEEFEKRPDMVALDALTRKVLKVPKSVIDAREKAWKTRKIEPKT